MTPASRHTPRLLATIGLLILTTACGSSPVPQPVPFMMRKSTHAQPQGATLIVGLPGSVAGQGKVHIEDRKTGKRATAVSSGAGSFSLVLRTGSKTDLVAQYENEDGTSDWVSMSEAQTGSLGPTLGQPKKGVVSSVDSRGEVTVTNDDGTGKPALMDATPDSNVVVTNAESGALATTTTDKAGVFKVIIAGASGDTVHVLLIDKDDPGVTSDFVSFKVP